MQEMLLLFAILGGALATVYGKATYAPWPYFIGAIFFFIAGIGILQTGWETFDGGSFTRTTVGNTDTFEFQSRTVTASLEGDADNQILWAAGNFLIIMTLGVFLLGARESWLNRQAQKEDG